MKNPFKSKKTKWLPLGRYVHAGADYITFFRKNLKTGMMEFKTKRVNINNRFDTSCYPILPVDLIDTKEAWVIMTKS